jgi:hypothetical protein
VSAGLVESNLSELVDARDEVPTSALHVAALVQSQESDDAVSEALVGLVVTSARYVHAAEVASRRLGS